jgi:hypothetical protein
MANISLTLYTNGFIGSVLMSPIQMGSLRVNNSVTNISRLGTFKGTLVKPQKGGWWVDTGIIRTVLNFQTIADVFLGKFKVSWLSKL